MSKDADTISALVRKSYDAFLANDRKTLDMLFSDNYTFTSPRDDHISKAEFFERCLPGSNLFTSFTIEKLFVESDEVVVIYRAELKDGTKVNDTEFIKIKNNKIMSTEVYFGR